MAETVIEIYGECNRSVHFGLENRRLRGHWSLRVSAGFATAPEFAQLQSTAPEIPGICIGLDIDKRTARIFDPLRETQAGRELWRQIEPILNQHPDVLPKGKPWPEVKRDRLTDDEVKTWAFEMRSILDCGLGKYVSGPELPDAESIKSQMPGKRKRHLLSTIQWKPESYYADAVPSKGEKVGNK